MTMSCGNRDSDDNEIRFGEIPRERRDIDDYDVEDDGRRQWSKMDAANDEDADCWINCDIGVL
jgi:hypothetical protein